MTQPEPNSNSLTDASCAPDGTSQAVVELTESASQFDFFQAVRRIEALSRDMPRAGHATQTKHEAIRISQTPALDFAPSTIDRIDAGNADANSTGESVQRRIHLSQRFFGLLGPSGPLGLHMTEQVREQTRHQNDPTLEAFLNLFHHRMAMLFYRAWSSSRGAVQRDRPDNDRFADYVGALSGSMSSNSGESASEAGQSESPNHDTQLHFTGRFASSHRNAEGLGAVVSGTVRAPAKVRTFVLRSLQLQSDDLTVLRRGISRDGRGGRLGQNVVLGRSVADRSSMIGLDIGPVPIQVFERVLPGGKLHARLRDLVRSYVDPGVDCKVRLILDHRTVPRMSLGRSGRLGRNSWIHSKRPSTDLGDCQFQI